MAKEYLKKSIFHLNSSISYVDGEEYLYYNIAVKF